MRFNLELLSLSLIIKDRVKFGVIISGLLVWGGNNNFGMNGLILFLRVIIFI